jgi:hypothetical protein
MSDPRPNPRYLDFNENKASLMWGFVLLVAACVVIVGRVKYFAGDQRSQSAGFALGILCALVGSVLLLKVYRIQVDRWAKTVSFQRGFRPFVLSHMFGYDELNRLDIQFFPGRRRTSPDYTLIIVMNQGDRLRLIRCVNPLFGSWRPLDPYQLGTQLSRELGCPFLPSKPAPSPPIPF